MKTSFILICLVLTSHINLAQQTQRDTLYSLQSEYFSETRFVSVHLPEEFTAEDTLPVVYYFDAQWEPYRNLTHSTINYLTAIHAFEKSIVVGIHNVNRQYELTPEPVNEDWKMPSLGGAALLENHLLEEVIPLIEMHYAVSHYRTGIGHSLGGTFVLNSLIDAPELFNAYIAVSPNLQLDEEEIALKIIRNVTQLSTSKKFVYASMGTDGQPDTDFLPSLEKLNAIMKLLNETDFQWNFQLQAGDNHGTTPLTSIPQALQLLHQFQQSLK